MKAVHAHDGDVVCRGDVKSSKAGMIAPKKWKKAFVQLTAGQKISLFEGA